MYVFGIDIGGTSIKIGCFYEDGSLKHQWEIPTRKEKVFQDLSKSILKYLDFQDLRIEDVYGYGIGAEQHS